MFVPLGEEVNSMWGLITHSACSTIRSYVAVVTHEASYTKATLKVLGKTLQFRFLHRGRISPLLTFNHLTIACQSPGPSRRELGATPTQKSAMHWSDILNTPSSPRAGAEGRRPQLSRSGCATRRLGQLHNANCICAVSETAQHGCLGKLMRI
jgi:hypothetical protein